MNKKQSVRGVTGCFTMILVLLGIGTLIDGAETNSVIMMLTGFVIVVVCLIAYFGVPFMQERKARQRRDKQYKYSSIVGDFRNTPIDYIADAFGYKREQVLDDLLELLKYGNFSGAYIDYDSESFIVPRNRVLRNVASQSAATRAPEMEDDSHFPEEYRQAKANLHRVINTRDAIEDAELQEKLTTLYNSLKKMFRRLEDKQDYMKDNDVKRLLNYYLPTIYSLLDDYRNLSLQGLTGQQFQELKTQLPGSLDAVNKAVYTISEQLYDDEILDVSADLTVLQRMLEQDGYAGMNIHDAGTLQ